MRTCAVWLLAASLAGCTAPPPPPVDGRTALYNHSLALPGLAEPRSQAELGRIARSLFDRPELLDCLSQRYPGVAILDLRVSASRESGEPDGQDIVRLGVVTRGVQRDHERWTRAIQDCTLERAHAWWASDSERLETPIPAQERP